MNISVKKYVVVNIINRRCPHHSLWTRVKSWRKNITVSHTQNSTAHGLFKEVVNIRNSFSFIKETNGKNILYRRIAKFLMEVENLID